MSRIYLNDEWFFTENFSNDLTKADFKGILKEVRIPHTCKETDFHYFDEHEYQMVSGYRKILFANPEWKGKSVTLTFEGVGHIATVFVNGSPVLTHSCGYTAFTVDVTELLQYGEENVIALSVDSNEKVNVPPFGFVIDYMTYGGIYRDVYMEIKDKKHIDDLFLRSKFHGKEISLVSNVKLSDDCLNEKLTITQSIVKNGEKIQLIKKELSSLEEKVSVSVTDVKLWSVEDPTLYEIVTELFVDETLCDSRVDAFGFRKAEFKADGFYLNDQKLQLRGLNRHQSYPYVGYAMPESMQRLDAEILKKELGCNAVRTSHYPQSHYFINECDKLGLLVFMEFPGWQHIGDEEWKAQAVINAEEMITEFRNHPSIILWGVRINESPDDDAFYIKTNEVAHDLDDSRQTGGVRCFKKSHLFEDVYTYNDFSHSGKNPGCDKKKAVTSDMNKAYLISEYNGHMYPTKTFDWEGHRVEHALRHARVLNDVKGNEDIAGSFGWCMFDYNTHKDFGSGDRICYHGVLDMFRNPKLASLIYACESEEQDVLELTSSMDIGEHPGCNRGLTYIISNADSVRMYKNDAFIKEYTKADSPYKNLKHGPMIIDDYIGDGILKNENFKKGQAEAVKYVLNFTATRGYDARSPKFIWNALKCVALYRMSMDDATKYYNKYIGDWGGTSTTYRFEAIKDGKVVKTIVKKPMTSWKLIAEANTKSLEEKNSYDVAEIRMKVCDENGNILPFFQETANVSVDGPIELIGPKNVALRGGMAGLYVKTTGKPGKASVSIQVQNHEPVVVNFDIFEKRI